MGEQEIESVSFGNEEKKQGGESESDAGRGKQLSARFRNLTWETRPFWFSKLLHAALTIGDWTEYGFGEFLETTHGKVGISHAYTAFLPSDR